MFPPVRRLSISTAATGWATIYLPIADLRSTPKPASASGIFRAFITISGTAISLLLRRWLRSSTTESKSTQSRRPPNKASFIYLIARPASRCFQLRTRKYPPSDLPGEVAAAEQPLPTKPAPYARQRLTEDMLTNRTPEAHQWALEQFRTYSQRGQFVPLSTKQNTIIFPGFDGGAEWGGPAFDPDSGLLYVNSNEMAWAVELAENTGDPRVARCLPEPVQHLPSRRHERLAAAVPIAGRRRAIA